MISTGLHSLLLLGGKEAINDHCLNRKKKQGLLNTKLSASLQVQQLFLIVLMSRSCYISSFTCILTLLPTLQNVLEEDEWGILSGILNYCNAF